MPPRTGHASAEDEHEKVAREFKHDLVSGPPGERPLVLQVLGWCYILTGIGLALVTVRETAVAGEISLTGVRNGVGVAVHVAVGVAVDAAKSWAWPVAAVVSLATVGLAAQGALAGDLVATLAALLHVGLAVAVLALRDRFEPPDETA